MVFICFFVTTNKRDKTIYIFCRYLFTMISILYRKTFFYYASQLPIIFTKYLFGTIEKNLFEKNYLYRIDIHHN